MRAVAHRARSAVGTSATLGRYGIVWPILLAREALAAYDDVLAVVMKLVLGRDWDERELDEARRRRRPRPSRSDGR